MNPAPSPPEPAWSDDEFLARFLDAGLPAARFDHRGHLRAAWLLLQRQPTEQAVASTCTAIARLAARLQVPHKYHRTLTEALVRLMAHRGARDPCLSWPEFLNRNPDLVEDARGLLARHYSETALQTDAARQRFVPPDRLPLPA